MEVFASRPLSGEGGLSTWACAATADRLTADMFKAGGQERGLGLRAHALACRLTAWQRCGRGMAEVWQRYDRG